MITKEEAFEREKKVKDLQRAQQIIKAEDTADWSEISLLANQETEEQAIETGVRDRHPIITTEELLSRQFPAQKWIIDHFMPEGGISLIVGEAGTLKSYVCLYIAKCLLTQEKLFGQFEVNRKCRILLIDKENKLSRIQRRLLGLGSPQSPQMWVIESPETFMLEDKEWVNYVQDFILVNQIDFVILDSFIDFFSGNENSSTDTAIAINSIRALTPPGQTINYTLIHHDSKPMPKMVRTAAQKTRGSSNIIAQVDTQFYFEKGKDNKSLLIEQGKSRDEEPLAKFEIKIVADQELGISDFIYGGEVKSDLSRIEDAADFIMNYLGLNPDSSRQNIIDAADNESITESTVKRALSLLKDKKLLDSKKDPNNSRRHLFYVLDNENDENMVQEIWLNE